MVMRRSPLSITPTPTPFATLFTFYWVNRYLDSRWLKLIYFLSNWTATKTLIPSLLSNSPLYLITFFPRRSRAYYSATSFFFFQFTFRLQNFVHHGDGTLCATLKELAAQIWHLNSRWFTLIFSFLTDSYQDTHTQSFIMVTASGRWFGVRLDAIISLLIGLVVSVVVLVSQDAGM